MTRQFRRTVILATTALWIGCSALVFSKMLSFDSAPGEPAKAPLRWPIESKMVRQAGLPTLVMTLHPRCPCSRASLEELSKIQTHCQGKIRTFVLAVEPPGATKNFAKTGLAAKAAEIPGVQLICDTNGDEAGRLGCATSGQVVLYSAAGQLIFAGGITEARGEMGDNDGLSTITSLVLGNSQKHSVSSTPVYGCPLFDPTRLGKANQCTK